MMLNSFQVTNFKAVRNSGSIHFGALTVLVGNNGSGKSSLIEAIETYQHIVSHGLDDAIGRFMGMEHFQNKRAKPDATIDFDLKIRGPVGPTRLMMKIASDSPRNQYAIVDERVDCKEHAVLSTWLSHERDLFGKQWAQGKSMLGSAMHLYEYATLVDSWQFLLLAPDRMGYPLPQKRTGGAVRLARDGSNIAEFLLELREADQAAFEGIVEALAFVLPYARDLQPATTSDVERKAWLQLSEANFKVPGWMLSTGTLRVVALLALLRHPTPPPLIVIEEIENGLDPRTMGMLVEEIRNAIDLKKTQLIATTHSPYLLDMLALEHVLLVERDASGEPKFHRPATDKSLAAWRDRFAPGQLYVMDRLHAPARKGKARG